MHLVSLLAIITALVLLGIATVRAPRLPAERTSWRINPEPEPGGEGLSAWIELLPDDDDDQPEPVLPPAQQVLAETAQVRAEPTSDRDTPVPARTNGQPSVGEPANRAPATEALEESNAGSLRPTPVLPAEAHGRSARDQPPAIDPPVLLASVAQHPPRIMPPPLGGDITEPEPEPPELEPQPAVGVTPRPNAEPAEQAPDPPARIVRRSGSVRLAPVPLPQPETEDRPPRKTLRRPSPDGEEEPPWAAGGVTARPSRRGLLRSVIPIVLVVPGRGRFHAPGCPLVGGGEVAEMTLAEAAAEGYEPCQVCRPADGPSP